MCWACVGFKMFKTKQVIRRCSAHRSHDQLSHCYFIYTYFIYIAHWKMTINILTRIEKNFELLLFNNQKKKARKNKCMIQKPLWAPWESPHPICLLWSACAAKWLKPRWFERRRGTAGTEGKRQRWHSCRWTTDVESIFFSFWQLNLNTKIPAVPFIPHLRIAPPVKHHHLSPPPFSLTATWAEWPDERWREI